MSWHHFVPWKLVFGKLDLHKQEGLFPLCLKYEDLQQLETLHLLILNILQDCLILHKQCNKFNQM